MGVKSGDKNHLLPTPFPSPLLLFEPRNKQGGGRPKKSKRGGEEGEKEGKARTFLSPSHPSSTQEKKKRRREEEKRRGKKSGQFTDYILFFLCAVIQGEGGGKRKVKGRGGGEEGKRGGRSISTSFILFYLEQARGRGEAGGWERKEENQKEKKEDVCNHRDYIIHHGVLPIGKKREGKEKGVSSLSSLEVRPAEERGIRGKRGKGGERGEGEEIFLSN